jgi:Effector Associated Constant Component 1
MVALHTRTSRSNPVRVLLRVAGDDPDSLRSLDEWLRSEREIAAHGDLRWGEVAPPEQLGVGIEVLSLSLNSPQLIRQLLAAIIQWRSSRHPAPVVTISAELDDGATVRIETSDPEVLSTALRQLASATTSGTLSRDGSWMPPGPDFDDEVAESAAPDYGSPGPDFDDD